MKNLKKTWEMIRYNQKTLVQFEFFYKVISAIFFIPLFLGMFRLTMKIAGYSYLTLENVLAFLSNPFSLLMLFLLILLMTLYALFDISALILILDCSYHKKKITMKEAIFTSLSKIKHVFSPKNIFMAFLILFLIPFLNLGISSSFISTIKVPEFIMDFIVQNKTLFILYLLALLFLAILLLRWIYAMHYFILENENFKNARKRSSKLSKKNKIKDFLVIACTEILTTLLYVLFVFLGIFLILLIHKVFYSIEFIRNFTITIIWIFIALSFLVFTLLATPISYASISGLYYVHKNERKEKIKAVPIVKIAEKEKRNYRFLKVGATLLTLLGGTMLTYAIYNGKFHFNIEYIRTIEVTAHRGASALYPENTLVAFQGAKELGADWVELDVQQTKDKKLIVLHDTNLKRTTGVNQNTWETNYDEIKELDAGSFFSDAFQGEKIPLLEEVILYAKENNLKLNIELKPTGHETDFESSVIDLIHQYDYQDNCVVTSQNYDVLFHVKEYDPTIQTVYVMSLAYGDITKLTYADHFSIEASSITKTLVKKIHNEGKEIYAWTINTEENMQKMISLNVDNIITDNITLAKETIAKSKTSSIVQEYIRLIRSWF